MSNKTAPGISSFSFGPAREELSTHAIPWTSTASNSSFSTANPAYTTATFEVEETSETTPSAAAGGVEEWLKDALVSVEAWARAFADFVVLHLWFIVIIGFTLFFIFFVCCLCACLFHAGCLGEDAKDRRRRRRKGPGGKGSDGQDYEYHAAPSTSRSFHEGENLPFYQATRDATIEEGEGGGISLENKGSKGCSSLNGEKGKQSTINRSTIKSHNSGDSGTGTLKKVNSAEMGNLTGTIMKELQAQGKSEDWTVGFAKMANALYLKDEDLDGFLIQEEARKVIHTYDKIYELNLILHNVDDSLLQCAASGGLVDLETLIRMLAAKHVPH